jgi:hypothetical protein
MIKNLTPHEVKISNGTNDFIIIPSSGIIARAVEETEREGWLPEGIEVVSKKYGKMNDVPDYQNGVFYIVSAMVRVAYPERDDLFSPGDLIRDEGGNIIACKNLVCNKV